MSDIELKIPHKLAKEEAKEKIKSQIDQFAPQVNLAAQWQDDNCVFSGPASGNLQVTDESIIISIKLGFAAKLLRGKIESTLKDGLQKALV